MHKKRLAKNIKEYIIEYKNYRLKVLNIGATITEYSLDNKNIVLFYDNITDYLNNTMYLGAIVGRTAGRIKNAVYGNTQLPKNFLNKHNLHGNDLHLKFFDVKEIENGLELSLFDEEGVYTGNANIKVVYKLTDNGLEQEIFANSDKPTLFNFTNHSYFNLKPNTDIKNLNLKIDSEKVWSLCEESLPKKYIDVKNTAFDFLNSKKIEENLKIYDKQFEVTKFIDNPYKLNGNVILSSDDLKLTITTNQPYIVVYTGNYIGDEKFKFANSETFNRAGICLETQKIPGDTELTTNYYSKTTFKLENIK